LELTITTEHSFLFLQPDRIWQKLCKNFFQKYVNKNSRVLEIAAGYCEFINNIQAKEKIAVDINPDIEKFASKDVQVLLSNSDNLSKIKIIQLMLSL